MPKRNRAQELTRHGILQEGYRMPEAVKVPVTDADKQGLGALTLWAQKYVNHIYSIGGHLGQPMEKRFTEPLYWRHVVGDAAKGHGLTYPLTVTARQRLRLQSGTDGHDERCRQIALGLNLGVGATSYYLPSNSLVMEDVELDIDADGTIVGGVYRWLDFDDVGERPAPNANFTSLDAAHEMTVSGRAAVLLGRFRDLVIDPATTLDRIYGTHRNDVTIAPPEHLAAIPEFRK